MGPPSFLERLLRLLTPPTSAAETPQPFLEDPMCPAEAAAVASADPKPPQSHVNNGNSETPDHLAQTSVGYSESAYPTYGVGSSNTSPPLFALVIGIDDYVGCGKLRGAVADARAMRDYLQETLQVSADHIRILFDRQATRDAIIKAFQTLRHDPRIQYGDPILIYYAGHGGELPGPQAWGVDHKIQCLLPRDYENRVVNPIPDRTIGALIDDIAKEKGDNISVVFDCCYSGSGTRPHNEGYTPRTVNLDAIRIPATLDNNIWGGRTGKISNGLIHHGLRSHILLAACGETELAYEHGGRGQFTTQLLSMLKRHAVNNLTYAQTIERIRLPKQHPQCEGLHQHRILFNARISPGEQGRRTVRSDHGKYLIDAGLAHGVAHGAVLTLYSELHPNFKGIVVVDGTVMIEDFGTTVTMPDERLKHAPFAKLTRVGRLPLYRAPGGNASLIVEKTLERTMSTCADDANVRAVSDAKEARMEVGVENDRITFKVLDQRVERLGLLKLPHTAAAGALARVLAAAAHYYWYLDLTNKKAPVLGQHEVAVNFYALEEVHDEWGLPIYITNGPGLCGKDPVDGSDVIDFVVDTDVVYGIEIKNNTSKDLYLNAFLFNNSALSIVPYYTQTCLGDPEAPLKRDGGTFTLGYGPPGTAPFVYALEEGQDVDVGHLKVFFATRPVDMSDVALASPFDDPPQARSGRAHGDEDGDDRDRADAGETRGARLSLSPADAQSYGELPPDTWFTIDVPIVQRRNATSV